MPNNINDSFPVESGLTTFAELRQNWNGLARMLTPGVLTPVCSANLLSAAGANMTLNVAPFASAFSRDEMSLSGLSAWGFAYGSNPTTSGLVLPTAPTSNAILHTIYAKAKDPTLDGTGGTVLDYVSSAVSASPVYVAPPVGGVELGTVLIPANATTLQSSGVVITNTHQRAIFHGVNELKNQAQRDLSLSKYFAFTNAGGTLMVNADVKVKRLDLGYTEEYLPATASSAFGAATAGWYPTRNGEAPFGEASVNSGQTVGTSATRFGWTIDQQRGLSLAGNGAFTAPWTGWYDLSLSIGLSTAGQCYWRSTDGTGAIWCANNISAGGQASGSEKAYLVAGNNYSVFAQGASAGTSVTAGRTRFSVRFIEPAQ